MSRTAGSASDLASDSSRTANEGEQKVPTEALGHRLRTIRSQLSQSDFAAGLGVTSKTYGLWERNDRTPDADTLALLCARGWNVNWLLTGKGPERLDAVNQGVSGAKLDPEMMQKAVESAIGVFQRFNKLPSANQLARASVLLYLLFTDNEPETAQPVDQLLARIMGEPVNADMPEPSNFPGFKGF